MMTTPQGWTQHFYIKNAREKHIVWNSFFFLYMVYIVLHPCQLTLSYPRGTEIWNPNLFLFWNLIKTTIVYKLLLCRSCKIRFKRTDFSVCLAKQKKSEYMCTVLLISIVSQGKNFAWKDIFSKHILYMSTIVFKKTYLSQSASVRRIYHKKKNKKCIFNKRKCMFSFRNKS